MEKRKLHNYLKTYRKRASLSQDELAYLLGCQEGAKVCRYERRARVPNLETLLAYECLFGAPTGELYAGLYQKVEKKIKRRARRLAKKLGEEAPTPAAERKMALLKQVTSAAARNTKQP